MKQNSFFMTQFRIVFFIANISMVFFSFAKNIQVHNITEKKMYAAVYYKPLRSNKHIKRKQSLMLIEPLSFSAVYRPPQKIDARRYLVVAENAHDLPIQIDKEQFDACCKIGVGIGTAGRIFDLFYLVDKGENMVLYDPVSLKVADIKEALLNNVSRIFDGYRMSLAKHAAIVTENKYNNIPAYVRIDNQLCIQEKNYLNLRTPKVKIALEKFLTTSLNGSYIPKIAIVNSGGGARSVIANIGFHLGAQKMGLLDAVTYDVGLSGGAWFLALWLCNAQDMQHFKDSMRFLMRDDLLIGNVNEAKLFLDALMVRFGLGQPVTLVNSWGALLANRYLSLHGNKRHQILWSDCADVVHDGNRPLPILSATSGHIPESFENRPKVPWYEFTPYEVGGVGNWLGNSFVPTWAFGRKFDHGVSQDMAPEIDLGGLMGVCGSAFAFSFARGYEHKIKDVPIIGSCIEYVLSKMNQETQYALGKKRFTVGKFHNFTKNISGSSVSDNDYIKMVDGGISFNLPYPPISGHGSRKADIIIFCDSSSHIERKGPTNLYMIEKYAREHGLKFPKIDVKRVAKQVISVFKDESDPEVPLVIYLPRIVADEVPYPSEVPKGFSSAFKTTKFAYKEKEFDALSAVTESNILYCQNRIKKEILLHIQQNDGI